MANHVSVSSRMKLLMPDDFSELALCAWRVELGTPDPENPLIEGEMPWDRGGVGDHGSVFVDPITGKWKAYLECTPAEEFPENQPENQGKSWNSENAHFRRVCLFESEDGLHWTRPMLSNVKYGLHEKTNIIFDIDEGTSGYASIFVDPSNAKWPYEMLVLREWWIPGFARPPQGNGYYRYRSADGRKWERIGDRVQGFDGDLCFFYRVGGALTPFGSIPGEEPLTEKYLAYYRLPGKLQPTDHVPVYEDCARRTVYRAASQDSYIWDFRDKTPLTADDRDHRDTQYQECVPLRVPGGYIAMVTMYLPITQTLNLRIAASRDGVRWWFPDRRPCLDNESLGDYGGGQIWQSQYLHVQDGNLYVYYGATESLHRQITDTRVPSVDVNYMERVIDHGGHFLPFTCALCRSFWKFDRIYALASSTGGTTFGRATTVSSDLGGTSLFVNMNSRPPKKASVPGLDEGLIQVELLDQSDQPIKGFTRDDCMPLKGDHACLSATWTGGRKAPAAARKARFYLKRAFLYGFSFQ
jgi:hypothetical protein